MQARTHRIRIQQRKEKNKLEALHTAIVTTSNESLVGARFLSGNPYDSHTLHGALEQAEIPFEIKQVMAFDRCGYRGVEGAGVQVWKSDQRCGVMRC